MTLSYRRHRWAPDGPGGVIILDNRDSFVFNLVHRFHEVGIPTSVIRSDAISINELQALRPAALVLSPGPGHPRDAGVSVDAVRAFGDRIPILGICLGHQAIGMAYGATISPSGAPRHGKESLVEHCGGGVFRDCDRPLRVGRYHSLVVEESSLGEELMVTARCGQWVMGIRHRDRPVFGLQFHPESILTPAGVSILARFGDEVEAASPP